MRGKKLTDVLTAEEIRKKTEVAEPEPARREIQEPYGLAPPPPSGLASKMSGMRSRVARYVKRAAILAVILTLILILHASDPVRIRVASLLGTTGGSKLAQTTSTAVPFAVVLAVAVTWFMDVG